MMPLDYNPESIHAKANDFIKQLNNDKEKPVYSSMMTSYKVISKFKAAPIEKREERPLAFYLAIDDIITMLNVNGFPAEAIISENDPENAEMAHALLDLFFGSHDDDVVEMIRATIQEMEKNGKKRNLISTL